VLEIWENYQMLHEGAREIICAYCCMSFIPDSDSKHASAVVCIVSYLFIYEIKSNFTYISIGKLIF
jgi:hypothetical protein